MKPLFSIIIPTFNRSFLLEKTLNSVLNQTFKNWEALIIDDGSNQENLVKIKSYAAVNSKIKFFEKSKNLPKGPSASRNIGIAESKGELIMFLDSDDILFEDCLKQRFEFVHLFKEFDFWVFKTRTFSDSIDFSYTYNTVPDITEENENRFYTEKFLNGKAPFTVISTLWKRDKLMQLGGFDSSFRTYEDPDFHIRALLKRLRVKTDFINKYDTYYRQKKEDYNHQNLKNDQIIQNKYRFAKKYIKQIEKYETDFIKNTLRSFGYPQNNKYFIIKFIYLGLLSNTLEIGFVIRAQLLLIYHFFNLQDMKGIGYHSIRKWTFE